MEDINQLVLELSKPFKASNIKQRVGSTNTEKTKGLVLNYIDARDAMDRLDEVVGANNWQDDYKSVKDTLFAGVGIKINNEWVWKWDAGAESNTEKEKGEASDSFKRACVKWGIGRFLYDIPASWLDLEKGKYFNNTTLEAYKTRLASYLEKVEQVQSKKAETPKTEVKKATMVILNGLLAKLNYDKKAVEDLKAKYGVASWLDMTDEQVQQVIKDLEH